MSIQNALIVFFFVIPHGLLSQEANDHPVSVKELLAQAEQSIAQPSIVSEIGTVLVGVVIALSIRYVLDQDRIALMGAGLYCLASTARISNERKIKKGEGVFQLGATLAHQPDKTRENQILNYFDQHNHVCHHGCTHTPRQISLQHQCFSAGLGNPDVTESGRRALVQKILSSC